MCCLYARPGKSCWGIFWTWLKLLYKKNKQLCRNPCTLCSATSERANPALPTPTYFGFPGITSFQSSSPGTLRLPLSWWKTIPLLDASFCGSFPDLFLEQYLYLTHTTPQYSSDDYSQYFIFFLIAFLLQAFVAETQLFWRGSLQNSWKAQHHIASPWMLAFWEEFPSGWDRARKFGLPDTHTFVLNVLRKNTGIETLDIILNVLFSYYFCTALDFKMLKQDWLC